MSVKEALFNFLNRYSDFHEKKFGYRPRGFYIPDAIFDGPSSDGFAYWKPVEIKETYDFKPLEDKIGFKIHNDLKEFLTSYYYFDPYSEIEGYLVNFRPSSPETTPIEVVSGSVVGSIQMGFDPQYIDFADAEVGEIGADRDYYLVLFHNLTGKIYLHEQHAKAQDNMVYLAESMEEFLNKLTSSFDNI